MRFKKLKRSCWCPDSWFCNKELLERLTCGDYCLDEFQDRERRPKLSCNKVVFGDDSSDEDDHEILSFREIFFADYCGRILFMYLLGLTCHVLVIIILFFRVPIFIYDFSTFFCEFETMTIVNGLIFTIISVVLVTTTILRCFRICVENSQDCHLVRFFTFVLAIPLVLILLFIGIGVFESTALFEGTNQTFYHCNVGVFWLQPGLVFFSQKEANLTGLYCSVHNGLSLCGLSSNEHFVNITHRYWVNGSHQIYFCPSEIQEGHDICFNYLITISKHLIPLCALILLFFLSLILFISFFENRMFRKSCVCCCLVRRVCCCFCFCHYFYCRCCSKLGAPSVWPSSSLPQEDDILYLN